MLSKSLLSLAIAASLVGMSGCNISSTADNDAVDNTPVESGTPEYIAENAATLGTTYPLFNPAKSTPIGLLEVPITSDLLYQGTADVDGADGTLPLTLGNPALGEDGYNPIFSAAADLDGFSTTAQIDIPFSAALQAASVSAANIFLIPLNYDDPLTGTLNTAAPISGNPAAVEASVITYGTGAVAEVVAVAATDSTPAIAAVAAVPAVPAVTGAGNVLRISPSTPLQPATRYLMVLTNGIKDSNGKPVIASPTYNLLSSSTDFLTGSDAATVSKKALQTAINSFEDLAEGFFTAAGLSYTRDDVVYAFSFTTGGTTAVLESMAAPANFVAAAVSAEAGAAFNITLPTKYRHAMETSLQVTTPGDITAAATATLTSLATDAAIGGAVDKATATAVLASLQADALAKGLITAESDAAAIQVAQGTLLGALATIHSAIPSPAPRVADFDGVKAGSFDDLIGATVLGNATATGGAGSVSSGTIKLPYFNGTPDLATNAATAALVFNGWTADDTLGTDLADVLAAASVPSAAVANPSTNVTRLFPLAKLQSWQDVPVTVVYSEAGCASGSYIPVIFQHGITSNRKSGFGVAAQLLAANPCYATVSIDLPQHGLIPTDAVLMGNLGETTGGQRHFGLKADASGLPTGMTGTGDSSGAMYIQIPSFQGTRDNNRQAVIDLLNLNASLQFMDFSSDGTSGDFKMDKVYFIGHSLGAILGTSFAAVNNTVGNKGYVAGCTTCNNTLPEVTAVMLSNPGGGFVKLLEHSAAFGPTIVGGIGALGSSAGLDLGQGTSLFELTANIFQATMDSVDPLNFAAKLKASGTPILTFEIAGNTDNASDLVVPIDAVENARAPSLPAPLAGTEPLVTELGLTAVAATQTDADTNLQVLVRFNDGEHSSFAGVDAATGNGVFVEMMAQMASFFASDGEALTVTNSNIIVSDAQ